MNLDEIVLRDGRKLIDVWPIIAELIGHAEPTAFLSIATGQRANLLLECIDDNDHSIFLHWFSPDGASDCMGQSID